MEHLLKVLCSFREKKQGTYSFAWDFNPVKQAAIAKDKQILRMICFLNIITITFLSIFKKNPLNATIL